MTFPIKKSVDESFNSNGQPKIQIPRAKNSNSVDLSNHNQNYMCTSKQSGTIDGSKQIESYKGSLIEKISQTKSNR